MKPDLLGDYISKYPRQTLIVVTFGFFLLWQTLAALLGCIIYLVLIRILKWRWWVVLGLGFIVATLALLMQVDFFTHPETLGHFTEGFILNFSSLLLIFDGYYASAISLVLNEDFYYCFGTPLLFAGLLALIDLMPNSAHEQTLLALQKAKLLTTNLVSQTRLNRALQKLKDNPQSIVLGVSRLTLKPVVMPSYFVNQVVLTLGTTGSGKTITLRRFYEFAARQGWPLILVDGKPTSENLTYIKNLAKKYGRCLYVFNSEPFHHYNCLAHGGYTELKDKIISLKDEWSSDYYRSIAEDYLQTTFEVLLKSGEPFDLKQVVRCLSFTELALIVRKIGNQDLVDRVRRLADYDQKDITGLQAHLSLLVNSELGHFFEVDEQTFCLRDALEERAFVYFSLPALKFPHFAKVLGKLVINDIKTVIGASDWQQKTFTIFDEFSVFAGDQVLNLVNMGRGKGLHTVFGTQGLADLKQISPEFESQIINCVNTIICHRLNDQESAEKISTWAGTQDTFDMTAQVTSTQSIDTLGSVRKNKSFIIHPDDIKQSLTPGEAFYISKIDRIQVKI